MSSVSVSLYFYLGKLSKLVINFSLAPHPKCQAYTNVEE